MTTPNRDILILGLRLDQIYVTAKASDEARNGIVKRGDIAFPTRSAQRVQDEVGGRRRGGN